MALIRTKGVLLVVCFLITAGILEYLIILHIHSGQKKLVFSDWENPKLSAGFSKVDSVEVENLEAKYKKIKFIPAGNKQDWIDKKKKILKNWVSIDSERKKEDVNDAAINVQAPPSPLPDRERDGEEAKADNVQNYNKDSLADDKVDEENIEPPLQRRAAIDKKVEENTYDKEELDEHGKPKNEREKDLDGEKKEHKPGRFEKAAQALQMLNNIRQVVKDTIGGKKEEKEEEKKEEINNKPDNAVVHNEESVYLDGELKNSAFFNGRPQEGEVLVETDKNLHPRELSPFEAAGNNIMFTLRTTRPYHDKRLPLLFETWMRKVNHSNIFIVTDGEDKKWLKKTWDESECDRVFFFFF